MDRRGSAAAIVYDCTGPVSSRNGSVFAGTSINDGAQVTSAYCVSNPSAAEVNRPFDLLPCQIRLYQAARDSLKAAWPF